MSLTARTIVGLLTLTGVARAGQFQEQDERLLDGRWQLVALEAAGKNAPRKSLPQMVFLIKDGRLSRTGKTEDLRPFRLAPPNAIDIPGRRDQVTKAIYKLEGDRLLLCFSQSATPVRPRSFDTTGTAYFCFTFRRDEEEAVAVAFGEFDAAFRHLDWDRLRKTFAADATMFSPSSRNPKRLEGVEEIGSVLRPMFEANKARRSATGAAPPAQRSHTEMGLKIRVMGESALVTFEPDDDAWVVRRTLVFHKMNAKWLIVHLHASNTEQRPPAGDRD